MNHRLFLIIPALFAAASGCADNDLFDQLESSTVSVVLKGTFESNSPRAWDVSSAEIVNDDSIAFVSPETALSSRAAPPAGSTLDPAFTSYNQYPTEFCFDVAKENLIAFGLCESLCNAGAHGAGTNNTNFH